MMPLTEMKDKWLNSVYDTQSTVQNAFTSHQLNNRGKGLDRKRRNIASIHSVEHYNCKSLGIENFGNMSKHEISGS